MKEEEESKSYKMMDNIPFQYVSLSMYYKLANKLDPDSSVVGNNWRLLAEKLGYSTQDIFVFESQQSQHGRNTIKVLQDYSQKQGSTVNQVYDALEEIDRPDALDELREGIPEIEKSYRDSLNKKHRHRDLIEDDYVCVTCDNMPYSKEAFQSYTQNHHKSAAMSPGNSYRMFTGNQQIPVSSSCKNYQRHNSFEPQCVNARLPGYEHESPDLKRQRSMPLSDSMMVRGHDSHSQYYRDMEPMDHAPSVREDPVPPGAALMRGIARYNNQHGLPHMNSTVHTNNSENLFRQPFNQFSRQTERAGLKLEIPAPSLKSADFFSPSPTPTTPSTPLGHLQKLANETPIQTEDGYKHLMKLKRDEELLQGKAGHLESPDRLMEFMSQQHPSMIGHGQGHHGEGQGHMRLSPRIPGPPNTFPLRSKSSSNSAATSPTSSSQTQQLTKSASVPGNMKSAEFRKAFWHIKVFVTYAADDKKHTQRVLSLCKCLEKNGFTCCVDIFHRKLPIEERHNWYQNRFDEADFILVVMSPKYRMEADSCEMENDADDSDSVDSDGENDLNNRPYRLHTKNIYRLMYREYIQSSQRCNRFVPLLFPGMVQDIIPNWMLDNYNSLFYYWPKQYKDLLWMLTKPENRVPEHVTPPVNRCIQDNDDAGTNGTEKSVESE